MRKPRHLEEGARYHVTARAHQRKHIFATVADKTLFLEVVARAKKRFGFRLESFCLMNNHFHAVVRPREGTSLSRILQWILSVFAQSWNRRHDLSDRVWGPRFFSRVITGFRDLWTTVRYIDHNPVKARLVAEPAQWLFGAASILRRGHPPAFVDLPEP